MTQAPFQLQPHNPDVLMCIANLSNDEVFTPPELVNQMLDTLADSWAAANNGASIWANEEVTFLDPCTKSGVFLREITKRLTVGLEMQIPDLTERVNHILTKQVYGIAITELTSLLARRSVYCSKYANGIHSIARKFRSEEGNVWFKQSQHSWEGGKCFHCGAAKSVFDRSEGLERYAYPFIHADNMREWIRERLGADMHFDVVIGNPPYQLADGGSGPSAAPIYQFFVEQAKQLEPRYLSMVIPSRWFAGGKGLDEFRERMLSDNRTRVIHDYLLVGEAFPGVALQGGVLYFLWDRENPGDCEVATHYENKVMSTVKRPLLELGADVFIRYNEAVPILKKIVAVEGGVPNSVALPESKRFANLVSPSKPFGIRANHEIRSTKRKGDLIAYWNGGPGFKQSGKGWVAHSEVTDAGDLIEKWKAIIGGAYGDRGGGGASRDSFPRAVLGRPFVGEPGSVCTETYVCIGPCSSEVEANNICSYIACKFTRFLVMLHKPAQHATKKVYAFVPTQDFSQSWTDAKLYAKYQLTDREIEFIESTIRPMDLDSDGGGVDVVEDDE
jgi:site-specific DNA-methyltransferase (adenine-specific)